MSSRVVEILSKLIACPSVNPRLSLENDPSAGETRVTAWLEAFAQRFGWRSARQGVHPQRDNFLAIFPGEREEVLLWEAHQDTVAVAGMTVEPFTATIRDGRVYGRGACDVKGGLAAMLAALLNLSSKPASQRPTILLASTVNEECGFTGARALADLWRNGGACAELRGELTTAEVRALRPSAAIIAEPTGLDIVVAHRGAVRWQCIVEGT